MKEKRRIFELKSLLRKRNIIKNIRLEKNLHFSTATFLRKESPESSEAESLILLRFKKPKHNLCNSHPVGQNLFKVSKITLVTLFF